MKHIYDIETNEIFTLFWDGPFCQWAKSDFAIGGVVYNCAEQYMMAVKAMVFNDMVAHRNIMEATDPQEQKRWGREVKDYCDQTWQKPQDNGRPLCWNVVHAGNVAKFSQCSPLKEILLSTGGTTIVEASPYDTLWGIGLDARHPDATDRTKWRGKNWLGEVLTEVRAQLSGGNSL